MTELRERAVPTVSIIMPAYNVSGYIGEALASVSKQTFKSYEVIVVNDGSPDVELLEHEIEPYRSFITYISQENAGLACARNAGIRASRGEFIALLDPDDIWEPTYLSEQLAYLEHRPDVDIVYCDALIFGDCPEAGTRFMSLCPSDGPVTLGSLLEQKCNVFVSVLARRHALVDVGLFSENLRRVEDYDLWLRVVQSGFKISYHDKLLAKYRRHKKVTLRRF